MGYQTVELGSPKTIKKYEGIDPEKITLDAKHMAQSTECPAEGTFIKSLKTVIERF